MSGPPGELALLANLGGEEGDRWRSSRSLPEVARAAALWASLFGANARIDGAPASPHAEPAFGWLPPAGASGALAWLETPEAAEDPSLAGQTRLGADPAAALRVNDKAFALEHGTSPPPLRGVARALDPGELTEPGTAVALLRETLGSWPAVWRDRGCLKPRYGSSGRGRVSLGPTASLDTPALRNALPRLAARGGAVVEPWLERTVDLSVHFHVGEGRDGPPLELLGSLVALTTASGVPRGHRGEIDARGRIHCGLRWDDAMREAGSELALAAAAAGYRGPCSIDGFAFQHGDGDELLRPTVEINGRFSLGIVALGCLRRARSALRERLGITPQDRAAVLVAAAPPAGERWDETGVDVVLPLPIAPLPGAPAVTEPASGPAIVGSRDPDALDALARRLVGTTAD